METVTSVGLVVLVVLGALVALLGGVAAALAVFAPKTKTDFDDKALVKVGKLKTVLEWVHAKLAALLGAVTKTKVEPKV